MGPISAQTYSLDLVGRLSSLRFVPNRCIAIECDVDGANADSFNMHRCELIR